MKKILLTILLVIIATICYAETVNRLQKQGSILIQPAPFWSDTIITAICDTGNGTMIYLVQTNGGSPIKTHIQPNGCSKTQAEK